MIRFASQTESAVLHDERELSACATRYMSVDEVAKAAGVQHSTVLRWCRQRLVYVIRQGAKRLIRAQSQWPTRAARQNW